MLCYANGKEWVCHMYLIVIYDIKQEKNYAKRQRNVYKTCKRYLNHIQNSVFEGELDQAQFASLKSELKAFLLVQFRSDNHRLLK